MTTYDVRIASPERLKAVRVSPGLFAALGVFPALGRALSDDDDRQNASVTVLSHGLWPRAFGRDPTIGRVITLDRQPYAVVGTCRSGSSFLSAARKPTRIRLRSSFRSPSLLRAPRVRWHVQQQEREAGGARHADDRTGIRAVFQLSDEAAADTITGIFRPRDLVLRSSRDADAAVASVRAEIRLDPSLPLTKPETVTDAIAESIRPQRFSMTIVGLFAIVALGLAAVGIDGVLANSVRQQADEIGMRVALGASAANVIWTVLRRALLLMGYRRRHRPGGRAGVDARDVRTAVRSAADRRRDVRRRP